jgi:hypothetical protein
MTRRSDPAGFFMPASTTVAVDMGGFAHYGPAIEFYEG